MPTSDWDTLEPTDGTPGNAYELGIDVLIGAAWVNVPDITAVNPTPAPKTRNRSSYAAKGKARPNTYARDYNLTFNVEIVRDNAEQYQEELQYLLDKAALFNEDNRITLRFFDTLGADYAYEGEFNIEHNRPNTGDEDAGWFGFSTTSYGGAERIPNPVNEALVPGIVSALPAGQSVGEEIVIHGVAFTGLTGVTIDGIAVVTPQLVDDRNIIAKIPVAAAGAAAIIVTTAEGASTAVNYTVV